MKQPGEFCGKYPGLEKYSVAELDGMLQQEIAVSGEERLQDMVIAAVNEAIRNAMDDMSASMGKITGGMNLPF